MDAACDLAAPGPRDCEAKSGELEKKRSSLGVVAHDDRKRDQKLTKFASLYLATSTSSAISFASMAMTTGWAEPWMARRLTNRLTAVF
ncbi:hypothetical protein E4U21_005176 [Claviceps maximensis]|nr:hypothetical protein E4U21_005176 [Claviceps maximensis]